MSNYFQNTMNDVGAKLNFARNTLMGRGKKIRDEKGFSYTADRILTSIGNFMDLGSTTKFSLNEAIANGMRAGGRRNFSASDLASVRDVDVADIAIATTVASHGLTYVAMERAMDSVAQQISFQGLRALNNVGGIEKNNKVVDPRLGFPIGTDFSRDGARTTGGEWKSGEQTVECGSPLTVGESKISITASIPGVGTKTVDIAADVSRDPLKAKMAMFEVGILSAVSCTIGDESTDGTLKFTSSITTDPSVTAEEDKSSSHSLNATVCGLFGISEEDSGTSEAHKYNVVCDGKAIKGKITFKLVASVCPDRILENDGAHTLKLKPYMDSTELVSTENRVVLQSSVEVQAQMNKVLRKNAQYGVNVDFGKRAIDQVVALYTYFIDTMIIRKLWEGVKDSEAMELNLNGFGGSDTINGWANFVATKNDRLGLFVDHMAATFLRRTGSPVTAWIVDETAGLMLASDKECFVPDPAITLRRDGLIGTYKGVPVVRNVYLNEKIDGYGVIIGVFKSPDGSAAPVAMGDYLPPYSTIPAVNANNPGELSQALFSQTACKCVVPGWAILGKIKAYGL